VATPVLAGAILRMIMGVVVDRLSPKKAAIIGQLVVIGALAYAWLVGVHSFNEVLVLGIFLGVAGASFAGGAAAGLALVSARAPGHRDGHRRGRQLGHRVRGAVRARAGDGLRLAQRVRAGADPAGDRAGGLLLHGQGRARRPPPKRFAEYLAVLRDKDAWWFMFFYSVTFGGFVGLASSLVIYFNTQYGLDPKMAGYFTAACVFAGSLVRPIGGNVADRIGGDQVAHRDVHPGGDLPRHRQRRTAPGVDGAGGLRGCDARAGHGQRRGVPARAAALPSSEIGVMTGLVGMAGGIGGFYLASSLGWSRQAHRLATSGASSSSRCWRSRRSSDSRR
jgi:NNP family nitrate/nitrite transporter-like MFS transporter